MAEEDNIKYDEKDTDINNVTDPYKEERVDEIQANSVNTKSSSKPDNRKLHQRRCPYCKQEFQTKVGANNWKNLFRKPTLEDWITLFILIMLVAAAFAYTTETKTCRDTLSNLDQICMQKRSNNTYTGNGVPYLGALNYTTVLNESNASEVNSSNDSSLNLTGYINNTTDINYSSNSTQDKNISK